MQKFIRVVQRLLLIGGGGIALCCIASCASQKTVTYTKAEAKGLHKYKEGYSYEKDEHGMLRSRSDKRSQYEGKSTYLGTTGYGGKQYRSKKYNAQRWQKQSNVTKPYMGNTDGSRFQTASNEAVQKSRFSESQSNYGNQEFGTRSVAKRGADKRYDRDITTDENHSIRKRRDNRPDPTIMSRKDYGSLSVTETKSLLGR